MYARVRSLKTSRRSIGRLSRKDRLFPAALLILTYRLDGGSDVDRGIGASAGITDDHILAARQQKAIDGGKGAVVCL